MTSLGARSEWYRETRRLAMKVARNGHGHPIFIRRFAEAAAQQVAVVLTRLTEVQLATLEGMKWLNRTSKSELAK